MFIQRNSDGSLSGGSVLACCTVQHSIIPSLVHVKAQHSLGMSQSKPPGFRGSDSRLRNDSAWCMSLKSCARAHVHIKYHYVLALTGQTDLPVETDDNVY